MVLIVYLPAPACNFHHTTVVPAIANTTAATELGTPPLLLAELVDNTHFEKSLRLVISFGSLKRAQFLNALEERLKPALNKVRSSAGSLQTTAGLALLVTVTPSISPSSSSSDSPQQHKQQQRNQQHTLSRNSSNDSSFIAAATQRHYLHQQWQKQQLQ